MVSVCNVVSRELPTNSLMTAAGLFNLRHKFRGMPAHIRSGTIVEIGSLHHEPGTPELEVHGGSTLLWAWHTVAAHIYTVDNDPIAIDRAARHIRECDGRLHPVLCDGISYLANCQQWIDLLYLDAWDVCADQSYQVNHVGAFLAALPCLHKGSLILVDDTDFPDGGKGRFVVPEAQCHGYIVLWSGRQTMMVHKHFSLSNAEETQLTGPIRQA